MFTIIGKLPPREVPGADEVLEGILLEFESGNVCRCWPAQADSGEQVRIVFWSEWKYAPSEEDANDLQALVDESMGETASLPLQLGSIDELRDATTAFLRGGPPLEVQ